MRLRALLAAAVLTVSTAPAAWAVAHGSDVPPGQYGFVAKLAMTKIPRPDGSTYSSFCTGALVAPDWVLTTGHCFHDAHRDRVSGKTPYPTTVTLGLTDEATESGIARKATEVLQAKENDVALVRLDSPVTTVTPLTVTRAAPKVGQQLTLAGWGSLTSSDPKPATRLQEGTVAVAKVDPTTLGVRGAAPEITTSACTYDSGAPYFSGNELVAVEATGPDCPHAGIETTSRADVIADWTATHTA
ncbi:esterase [Amycolatopsis mediterranei S699]|uniref:Secreted esterase n=2 Tax=Amycolatopsis mediterranei TaxID=33910 RepID=A0A0H3CTC3_AMYMU|nr:trypsin-like serine protease [Amycolatopsis mediterranei]ADJ41882.1 secreted esterase [Amycolatopsis mediterranei U32]AEK38553.1 esterase [Amycolatopsis mediterranei S699]AFO73592.1 esterase [Amycolatopsis mediterranei S699]AGT80721.1 esterase [Amycolatopsis mediterranei RB]KDO09028.1 esterase [Amycolatopsis mediterranei]